MRRNLLVAGLCACLSSVFAAPAAAQGEDATRPGGSTFLGDTGLWFVPSAEVLAGGAFAASGQVMNLDREQGFSSIQHLGGTFAAGVGGRVEIFGSVRFLTRIDRDVQPLFGSGSGPAAARVRGVLNSYPLASTAFSGNQFGDVLVGAKFNLLSEQRLDPAALAVRAFVKLPTGDEQAGVSSGQFDGEIDLVVSKVAGNVEIAGFGGFAFRSDPSGLDVANSFAWGLGIGAPVRGPLAVFGEVGGEAYTGGEVTLNEPLRGADGTMSGLLTELRSPLDVTVGLRWNGPGGFSVGGGLNWATRHPNRSVAGQTSDVKDRLGLLLRIGYHPGVPVYLPPPPPPPPPPANRPPTVTAVCDPCELGFGEESLVRADAEDPDGDPLDYRWNSPAGELTEAAGDASRRWRAPDQAGSVPVTVTVSDGRGGSASDTVTIAVNAPPPPPREFVFEDVHFDFDRYTLRAGAARVLDEVVAALAEEPDLRIEIEGHTCNIGTAEYNLALGDRRASAVREYLTGRGVDANRLQTVSYGEERPDHDNAREETRRLNRRAALVVRLQ